MRSIAIALLAAAVALASAVYADESSLASVSIVDMPRPQERWGFAPRGITVMPGSWVTWSNDGYDAHTVTAADASFDSGELQPSEGFSWYFDQPGTYAYLCQLHPWMQGQISVVDPNATDSSAQGLIQVVEQVSRVFDPS